MVPIAPRYDIRIVDLVRALDDRSVPIAEVHRRVASAAERIGLFRPSYAHLRRIVHAERDRRDAIREIVEDVGLRLLLGRYVDPYRLVDRIEDARALGWPALRGENRQVAQSHKLWLKRFG